MLESLSRGNFKDRIISGIKSAAKKGAVALTDGALAALSSHFDLKLEPEEEKAVGHVIDTQAISGAGTRDVGIAGSVAVTVLNAETSATVANSGEALNVTGEMNVEASELRSVKSVASAALDAKGNADANKSADKDANKDVSKGDNSAANDTVNLAVSAGGTAKILEGDMADRQPKIYVSLEEGYKMPEGNKASYTYTVKSTGLLKSGTVALTQDGDQWVLDTKSGDLNTEDIDLDKGISLELKPVEVLNKVPRPDVSLSPVPVEKGAVSVSVKGREANDDGTVSAHEGETVQIKIARAEGRRLSALGYSWKDADGNTHDVEFEKSASKNAFALVSSNAKEYVYTFRMPAGEITDIVVAFEKGDEEDAGDSQTASKDEKGRTVGVGAAFSMVYGDSAVKAVVQRTTVSAGALSVKAASDHKENIASAAGSDPLGGELNADAAKDFSLDASAALNLLDNGITAAVKAGNTKVNTGDLTVEAAENAVTETSFSAFAVGGETAIGASVAVNIASSAVNAEVAGSAQVAGGASVKANSHSEDTTKAIATAMGADIARNLAKLGEKAEKLEEKSGKLLDGSYIDEIGKKQDPKQDKKSENKTSSLINEKLDRKQQESGKKSSGSASTSTNVLRTLGVQTEGMEQVEELETLENKIKDTTGQDVGVKNDSKDEKTSWQVAAAVGVTVSDHAAAVTVGAITAGKAIDAQAENTGNFNTMGTGAAMSLADHANAIAAGVAFSWNENAARVQANGDLISNGKEAIRLTTRLTQNLDGDFAGKLAAQALSGSVAGKDSGLAIAGAISVVHSEAQSSVNVAGGDSALMRQIKGGDILVEATDKSKLTSRAGGLSVSKGSSLGLGIASSNVISKNEITAKLGDNTSVAGGSFKLNADKQAVTFDDYRNLIDKSYFITDSSKLNEEQRKEAKTGLIDLHKGEGENNYKLNVNLSSDKLLDAVDGLNFLSAQNTYVEAIAGSLSAAPAMGSVGATVSLLRSFDTVSATSGDQLNVNAGGSFAQKAETRGRHTGVHRSDERRHRR